MTEMGATNYFLVMGRYTDSITTASRSQFVDVFPFDDRDLDATREAWANADILADSLHGGRISMWRLPKYRGAWDSRARLVYAGQAVVEDREVA